MNMLCEHCQKHTATYHYKHIVNGQLTELHLCPNCASAIAAGGDSFGGLASLFSGGLKGRAEPARRVCSVCGATASEISKTAYAGCSECYKTFAQMFRPYITKLHGHVTHRGRVPLSAKKPEPQIDETAAKLEELKKVMAEAIRTEQFEKAAELRDQINALKPKDNN